MACFDILLVVVNVSHRALSWLRRHLRRHRVQCPKVEVTRSPSDAYLEEESDGGGDDKNGDLLKHFLKPVNDFID